MHANESICTAIVQHEQINLQVWIFFNKFKKMAPIVLDSCFFLPLSLFSFERGGGGGERDEESGFLGSKIRETRKRRDQVSFSC